jgi:hypothetical protein
MEELDDRGEGRRSTSVANPILRVGRTPVTGPARACRRASSAGRGSNRSRRESLVMIRRSFSGRSDHRTRSPPAVDLIGLVAGTNSGRVCFLRGEKIGDDTMLRKSRLAIAAALLLGAASAAQAASDNQSDPTRGFPYGPEDQRVGGNAVNPGDHLSTRPGGACPPQALNSRAAAKADDTIMSDGKCWLNTSNGNYGWADCAKSRR